MILRRLRCLIWIIELNKEIKIWFPFIIINNWYFDLFLIIFRTKSKFFINMRKIFRCKSGISNSSVANGNFLAAFFYNSNLNKNIALSNGILKAFETYERIWTLYLVLSLFLINLSFSSLELNEFFIGSSSSLSILKSLKE